MTILAQKYERMLECLEDARETLSPEGLIVVRMTYPTYASLRKEHEFRGHSMSMESVYNFWLEMVTSPWGSDADWKVEFCEGRRSK